MRGRSEYKSNINITLFYFIFYVTRSYKEIQVFLFFFFYRHKKNITLYVSMYTLVVNLCGHENFL